MGIENIKDVIIMKMINRIIGQVQAIKNGYPSKNDIWQICMLQY